MRRVARGLLTLILALAAPSIAAADEDFATAVAGPRFDVAFTFGGFGTPSLNRMAMGLRATAWPNRFVGGELLVLGAPDRREADYTPETIRHRYEEEVWSLTSRELGFFGGSFVVAPVLGRFRAGGERFGEARAGEFGVHFTLGGGVVATQDDTFLVRSPCDQYTTAAERQQDTANGCHLTDQTHPAALLGGGLRAVLPPGFLLRLDATVMPHPEEAQRDGEVGRASVFPLFVTMSIGGSIPLLAP